MFLRNISGKSKGLSGKQVREVQKIISKQAIGTCFAINMI
tara:strand:- start:420 stop:539 length:120 start_codon:yes stop_codon:yes gene_type:complete